jgi:hypothetical protein
MLANGDVLVPMTKEGRTTMERVSVGEERHAFWVGQVQKQTRADRGGTAVAVFVGALLAFFAVWGLAQASPDNIAVPVKFFVNSDTYDQITGSGSSGAAGSGDSSDPYAADGACLGSSDVAADDWDPDC